MSNPIPNPPRRRLSKKTVHILAMSTPLFQVPSRTRKARPKHHQATTRAQIVPHLLLGFNLPKRSTSHAQIIGWKDTTFWNIFFCLRHRRFHHQYRCRHQRCPSRRRDLLEMKGWPLIKIKATLIRTRRNRTKIHSTIISSNTLIPPQHPSSYAEWMGPSLLLMPILDSYVVCLLLGQP